MLIKTCSERATEGTILLKHKQPFSEKVRDKHLPPVRFLASHNPSANMSTSDVDPSPNAEKHKTQTRMMAMYVGKARERYYVTAAHRSEEMRQKRGVPTPIASIHLWLAPSRHQGKVHQAEYTGLPLQLYHTVYLRITTIRGYQEKAPPPSITSKVNRLRITLAHCHMTTDW